MDDVMLIPRTGEMVPNLELALTNFEQVGKALLTMVGRSAGKNEADLAAPRPNRANRRNQARRRVRIAWAKKQQLAGQARASVPRAIRRAAHRRSLAL